MGCILKCVNPGRKHNELLSQSVSESNESISSGPTGAEGDLSRVQLLAALDGNHLDRV